jgi:hypothetical protein
MPVPLIQEQTGDLWNTNAGDYLPSTTWDAAMASASLAAQKTSMGIAADFYLKNEMEKMPLQKTLTVPELNEKYMGSGITWTSPQKEIVADLIYNAHRRSSLYANRAALGQGVISEGANLAASLLIGAGDPLMIGGGMALGAALKGTSLFARTAEGAFARPGLLPTLGRGAIEGGAVMVPLEIADVARNRQYQQDFSMTESLANIAMGMGFGMTVEGLKFAGREGFARAKVAAENWLGRNTKAEDNARFSEMAAGQMAEGKRPMITPVLEAIQRERDGAGPIPEGGSRLEYAYEKTDTSQPVNKRYYLGTNSQAEQLHVAAPEAKNSTTDFGVGLYGSDKLASENGFAASSLNESPGIIHQYETQGAKLFDTEASLDQGTAAILAAEIRPFEKNVAKALVDGDISLRQAYDHMPGEAKARLNEKLSELGYDGLHYTEGEGAGKRNGIMMFPDKAENVRVLDEKIQSDPTVKAGLSQDELDGIVRRYNAKETKHSTPLRLRPSTHRIAREPKPMSQRTTP